jgi:hypothetical protein
LHAVFLSQSVAAVLRASCLVPGAWCLVPGTVPRPSCVIPRRSAWATRRTSGTLPSLFLEFADFRAK